MRTVTISAACCSCCKPWKTMHGNAQVR